MKQPGKDCTNILIIFIVSLSFSLASLFYLNTVLTYEESICSLELK